MELLEFRFQKEIESGREAVLWNYWDHEHLDIVHKNSFTDIKIFYEDSKMAIILNTFRLPIFKFIKNTGMSTYVFHEKYKFSDFQMLMFGIPFCSTITLHEITSSRCKIEMHYRYYLSGWKNLIFKPLLKIMANRWNQQLWDEDLSLKLRRQKVMASGFKDFNGLPENIEDRFKDYHKTQNIPIPKPNGCRIDSLRNELYEKF